MSLPFLPPSTQPSPLSSFMGDAPACPPATPPLSGKSSSSPLSGRDGIVNEVLSQGYLHSDI